MTTNCQTANNSLFEIAGLGSLEIEVTSDITAIENEWRWLEANGICSLYQSYEWIKNWLNHVAGPARTTPKLVVGRKNGELIFILPLGVRNRGPFTIAGWLGDSHSNFHMGLYTARFVQTITPEGLRQLMESISKHLDYADVLELCCQPVVWQGYTNPFTYLRWQESHNHAFALDLSEGFDAALNRKNGSRKRKKHRWQQNKLKSVGGAHLRVADTEEEIEAFLKTAFSQMGKRFDKAGIWNTFQDKGIEEFFSQTAINSIGKKEPELIIFGLEIDGEIRATFAGGIKQGQFSGCFISFGDDEYTQISPGELIIHLVIRHCVDLGVKVFDLGRGEERYKTSWCDTTITMFDTNIALTKRAIAYSAYVRTKTAIKRSVRNNDKLWNIAKKFRARYYGRI